MTTFPDDPDIHPDELVTEKVYVPVDIVEIVVVVPVPLVVTAPGFRVTVQVPVDGKPLSSTLPVDKIHVGEVMVPIPGATGVSGWASITTLADDKEMHPASLLTI